ncbi:MAG: 2-isopropylmalate synthase, partial [Planctomycetes bacterium]|nr:2-isopropylmalate synthase [Planctomycetota bacterium]
QAPDIFQLITFHISSGTSVIPTATVQLKVEDDKQTDASTGDGPIDAVYKAIDRITGISCDLTDYSIRAITGGKDAMGEVSLEVISDDMTVRGRATSTDILEASARAYLAAVNRIAKARRNGDEISESFHGM